VGATTACLERGRGSGWCRTSKKEGKEKEERKICDVKAQTYGASEKVIREGDKKKRT